MENNQNQLFLLTDEELIKIGKKNYSNVVDVKDKTDIKLEVKNLQISFRTQGGILKAVREISFDLKRGETLAIVGESGSGKSVTSKAIMGILAGNSIVEGGEILYDGQDLLKINEEDFHKIRGDKIAMIFQDPMSSLNPIMKVGQQLTEAMILKGKSSKRNSRNAFNGLLKTLNLTIDAANAGNVDYNKDEVAYKVKTFDSFCIEALKLEDQYNNAMSEASEIEFEIDNLLFYISKNHKVDLIKSLKEIYVRSSLCYHPFVIKKENTEFEDLRNKLALQIANAKDVDLENVTSILNQMRKMVHEASIKDKPNFFTLGYYVMTNPDEDIYSMNISELNKMTRAYLDENFMLDFINLSKGAVLYSHQESLRKKTETLNALYSLLGYTYLSEIDKSEFVRRAKNVAELVNNCIDKLEIKKNSTEYVFKSAILTAINRYFYGVKRNPIELKKYERQKAKYDNLIANGKEPDWKLNPLVHVDLDLALGNIRKVIETLISSFQADIRKTSFNEFDKTVEIIDFLKEQASIVVRKMNKKIAKANAIKLLEEVGIPDPAIRYNQYPFELSGGMRQRIVIAIALSANPDILICDEPTTALDVTIQSQILELINVIKKERNLSVIFITHNLGVVANMADRIAVMYAGKIVEYGLSEEIFYEPCHPYTWALLSSMPDLETKDKLESIPGTPPNMIFPPVGDAFAPRNKYALEIDFEMQPPLFKVTDTHYAATWLLHPDAPKVELPKIIQDRVARYKANKESEE